MVSREVYQASEHQARSQGLVEELNRVLPSDAFTRDVRVALYRYALIRNSWGTTNLDAGPVDLARVTELYDAYEQGVTRTGKLLPSEREVVNYFRLIDDLPTDAFDVSLEDVRLLHQDYFQGVPLHNGAKPGQWKTTNNAVHGPHGKLTTTPHQDVEQALQGLLSWYNTSTLPLTTRVGLFYHEFERIHPFGDGNGRAGRLTAIFLLSSGGLDAIRYCPIDDAINEDRAEYYLALSRGDHGDLEYWADYFNAQIVSGYKRAHFTATRLQNIPPSVPVESRRLLEHLFIHKVNTFAQRDVRAFYLQDSDRTVPRRLDELVQLGFLSRSGTGRGSQYHVNPPAAAAVGPQ